ncbi:MAG TPA: nucleotidyl transferase AbiEii/AbiGii toxin family protein [Steroidobacteraceae bacterium]|nr:nucleotidyl transferase AbiEii/AbiGii toxin family protein [Steroidobacteraceae bacterium]
MNQDYVDTVRLLLAIAPAVFRAPHFALKGGTALNLFLHDMPRLSVDIDVVFTDHTPNREDALRTIAADLKAAKSAISTMGFRATLPATRSGDDVKLFVEGNGLQVKVEVNFVFHISPDTTVPSTKSCFRKDFPWSPPLQTSSRA